jgi:hypothetical protein
MESTTQFLMLIGVVIIAALACFKPVRWGIKEATKRIMKRKNSK